MADIIGLSSETIIGLLEPFAPVVTAGGIINSIRDQIPDPVYDEAGNPLPDVDGSFLRVQSLYRWLSDAIREMSRRANWLIPDWYALPSENRAESYTLDSKWVGVEALWVNQLRCTFLDEAWRIYPNAYVGQPLTYSLHRRAGALDISLYGAPNLTDKQTVLMSDLPPGGNVVHVASTAGFLSFGWLKVEGELIEYRTLDPVMNTVSVLRRGRAGTQAMQHNLHAPVIHCSIWIKGLRSPLNVRSSTDPIEIPEAFHAGLEYYVLSKVREAEQARGEAKSLMQDFIEICKDISADPVWQATDGTYSVRPYGSYHGGPLYGTGFGVIVP